MKTRVLLFVVLLLALSMPLIAASPLLPQPYYLLLFPDMSAVYQYVGMNDEPVLTYSCPPTGRCMALEWLYANPMQPLAYDGPDEDTSADIFSDAFSASTVRLRSVAPPENRIHFPCAINLPCVETPPVAIR